MPTTMISYNPCCMDAGAGIVSDTVRVAIRNLKKIEDTGAAMY